ncbi:IclR family transcriptional regulator [Halococcus salifodinae]|uniref:IclR family transcriptional regulator n=1 Tax=Halococcus salifodinae TaxID=36738 RepID=UPI0006777B03|nr:IclR family transcriptional regulator [Halococcus salifodinae]
MAKQQTRPTVKTARTTLEILEALKQRNGATVTDLTDAFDLSNSSIHNYLTTLERDGYVMKKDDTYHVGLRLLSLGGAARHGEQIYDIAKDEVRAIADETGELANLLVEEHGKGIYVYRAQGENAVMTDSYIGQRVYLHNTALGNAILAHLPEDRVNEILDQHGMPAATENTITNRDDLFAELERIREEGVAFDDEARLKGLRCVAVPIVNNNDTVEGAISVSGPASRFEGEWFQEELPEKLKRIANVVELNTTYT